MLRKKIKIYYILFIWFNKIVKEIIIGTSTKDYFGKFDNIFTDI